MCAHTRVVIVSFRVSCSERVFASVRGGIFHGFPARTQNRYIIMGTVTTVHNAHWENRRRGRRRRYGRGSLCGAKEVIIIDGADVPICVYTFIYLSLTHSLFLCINKVYYFIVYHNRPPSTVYTIYTIIIIILYAYTQGEPL